MAQVQSLANLCESAVSTFFTTVPSHFSKPSVELIHFLLSGVLCAVKSLGLCPMWPHIFQKNTSKEGMQRTVGEFSLR